MAAGYPTDPAKDATSLTDDTSVTSAELVRQFGFWRQQAEHGPVLVSHHGRDTHVLLTKGDFDTLLSREPTRSNDPFQLLQELTDRLAQGVIILDAHLHVTLINPAACNALRTKRGDLLGKHVEEAIPAFKTSFLYPKMLRALQHGESSAADAPSLLRQDGWVHFETFPFDGGVAALFRDITEEVRMHRLADAKAALIRAMEMHGEVGHVRVSSRGIISRVDNVFTSMLQLPEDRLLGVPLIDIVARTQRVVVRDALEEVLSKGETATLETQLLANDGSLVTIRAAMVELRGEYASEGAVMVATRH